jgi:hypothetical protein
MKKQTQSTPNGGFRITCGMTGRRIGSGRFEKTKPISCPTDREAKGAHHVSYLFYNTYEVFSAISAVSAVNQLTRLRDGFVHGPEDGVDEQPAERRVLEVVRVAQRGEEDAGPAVAVGPGDRLGVLVGDRADQELLRRSG